VITFVWRSPNMTLIGYMPEIGDSFRTSFIHHVGRTPNRLIGRIGMYQCLDADSGGTDVAGF
jgi:hypothetical protein